MARSNPLPKSQFYLMLCGLLAGAATLFYFRPSAQMQPIVTTLRAEPRSRVNSVAFSPDGQTVALSVRHFSPMPNTMASAWVQLHDARTGALTGTFSCGSYIGSVSFSPNGQEIVCEMHPPVAHDFPSGRKKRVFAEAGGGHTGVLPSPDGRFWAGDAGNTVLLWDARNGRVARVLGDSGSARTRRTFKLPFVRCAAFSPDGEFIVSGHTDGALRVWKVADGALHRTLATPGPTAVRGAGVASVAFSPDGSLVAASDARIIRLWDVRTGQLSRSWQAPEKVSIFDLCFSPDGKMLAGGGPNFSWRTPRPSAHGFGPRTRDTVAEINLWDVKTGRRRHRLRGGHWIIRLAFSPDGKTIASSGDDETALLWRVPNS